MTNDTTQSIQRSAGRFLSGTLLSRATGMLRDMAMGFAFGTESALAAFMIAYRFAHLARRLFGEGSLQNTFVPHFEDFRKTNPSRAFIFFRDLKASLALLLIGLTLSGMGVLSILISQFEWSANSEQILTFTLIMLPSLIFICLYGLNAALLGCENSYFTASIAPAAFNCVWIIAALSFRNFSPNEAMLLLSSSVILGCFAQWAVTLPRMHEIIPTNLPFPVPFSSDVRKLIKPLALANFGVAASQINNAIDPLFALFANQEGPAWLWFAIRIQQLPLALFGIALSSALLPPISRAIKSENKEQFHHFFQFAYRKLLALTCLITAGIFATAPTCVNLLFGHGKFGMESVEGTAQCLLGYGIGLFPMAYIIIAAPALFAFNDYKTPTQGALFAMGLNIALNALFVFVFKWGAVSIALATSLAAFWNAYFLSRALGKQAGKTENRTTLKSVSKIACIALLSLSAVWMTDLQMLGNIPALQLMRGIPLELSQNLWNQIILVAMEGLAFFSAATISAYVLNAKEFYIKN